MASDKEIAITPDLNNSALTFGPTFSTLLKLKLFPKDLSRLTFISSMTFFLLSLFSNFPSHGQKSQQCHSLSIQL